MNTKTEINTINTSELVFNFIQQIEMVDAHELARFEAQEKSVGFLRLLRNQYSTIQHGNAKQIKAGEMPHTIALEAITRLWGSKERNGDFVNFKEYQMKQLKYYIETGEIYTRKKETLQEKAAIKIAKLEKELKAEQTKLAKAAKAKADADAAKAKADADAAKAKADAEQTIDEIHTIMDENPQGADAIKYELIDIIESAEKTIVDADADAAKAKADAEQADAIKAKADADVNITTDKLTKAKDKLANLSAGKADNKKSEPKLDFKVLNFSQDCKDTALMILEELEREATSAAELLYLAKLILDKYNK
jgi:hypothetical protein